MQWDRGYAKGVGQTDSFVYENWGMLLCYAGIMGGVFAATISDHVFNSKPGPVTAVLCGLMLTGAVMMTLLVGSPALPWTIVFMAMCIIGVHGMLSGTANMDFGGRKNVGIAVGIIDGSVYAGTAVMSLTHYKLLPDGATASDTQTGSPGRRQRSRWHWPGCCSCAGCGTPSPRARKILVPLLGSGAHVRVGQLAPLREPLAGSHQHSAVVFGKHRRLPLRPRFEVDRPLALPVPLSLHFGVAQPNPELNRRRNPLRQGLVLHIAAYARQLESAI